MSESERPIRPWIGRAGAYLSLLFILLTPFGAPAVVVGVAAIACFVERYRQLHNTSAKFRLHVVLPAVLIALAIALPIWGHDSGHYAGGETGKSGTHNHFLWEAGHIH